MSNRPALSRTFATALADYAVPPSAFNVSSEYDHDQSVGENWLGPIRSAFATKTLTAFRRAGMRRRVITGPIRAAKRLSLKG